MRLPGSVVEVDVQGRVKIHSSFLMEKEKKKEKQLLTMKEDHCDESR